VSLSIYKVKFQPLNYSASLGDEEFSFLECFCCDDGTYFIDEDILVRQIEAYKEGGDENKLPQYLIEFLREKLNEEGEGFSIIIG